MNARHPAPLAHASDWLTFDATFSVGRRTVGMTFFAPDVAAADKYAAKVAGEMHVDTGRKVAVVGVVAR